MAELFTVDPTAFNRAVRDLIANVDKDSKQVMREEMGLLVGRCIELTAPPHGRGGAGEAKRIGEAAVDHDVRKIFRGASDAYIDYGLRKFKRLQTSGGGHPLFSKTVDPSFHEDFRFRGKVKRKGTRLISVGKLKFADKVHVPEGPLASFIRNLQRHVGQAKAGWMSAAVKFGTKGIPAWVRRHGTKDGYAVENFGKNGGYLEAVNTNKAISSLDFVGAIVRRAVQGRARDIQAKLTRIIERNAKKFSRL